jgi:DNA-binding transcriptional regulator WhiA
MKYQINQDFLNEINTEEKAYFLGFFYADGYNNEKQGKLILSLNEKDKEILEKFNNLFYQSYHPLYKAKINPKQRRPNQMYSLCICNKKMSQLMKKWGAPQNKTFIIQFPFWLEKSLWKDFIRGYFDGDGSLTKHQRKYPTPEFAINIASNHNFINTLKLVINELTNLDFKVCQRDTISLCWIGGNRKTQRFLDWLYKDANIFLQRKYLRYQDLKQINLKVLKDRRYTFQAHNRWYICSKNPTGSKVAGGFTTEEEAYQALQKAIT